MMTASRFFGTRLHNFHSKKIKHLKKLFFFQVFLLQLELEDYPEAYTAMTSNPDDERRRECLRKFVLHLSERGDLAPLVEVWNLRRRKISDRSKPSLD